MNDVCPKIKTVCYHCSESYGITFCIKKPTVIKEKKDSKKLTVLLTSKYVYFKMNEFDECPIGKDKK